LNSLGRRSRSERLRPKVPLYPFHEHVFPRLALLVFLLALPAEEDVFSLDRLFRTSRRRERETAGPA